MAEFTVRNPDAKLPIDPDVKLPPALAAQVAAADAAHAAAYQTPAPAAPAAPVQEQAPAAPAAPVPAAPVQEQAPAPARAAVPETGEPGSWEHRFHAMKGRFDQSQQTIGGMQQQMQELGDELMRTQSLIQMNPQERQAATGQPLRPGNSPRRLVNDDDVKTYGPDLIDFVQRAARDAVEPDLAETTKQVRKVGQQVTRNAQQEMLGELAAAVPNWQEINVDNRFKSWCHLPDVYSGQVRGKLLNAAFQAASAPRVIAFFKGFLAEEQATGQLPDPAQQQQVLPAPRQAAVSLESLAAPGRPKPAGGEGSAAAADKPVFTRAQISGFYTSVRQGAYVGRDADKLRDEQAIFAAQREGRVRG